MECIFITPFLSLWYMYTPEVYQPGITSLLSLHDVKGERKEKAARALLRGESGNVQRSVYPKLLPKLHSILSLGLVKITHR